MDYWMQSALTALPPQATHFALPVVPGQILHVDGDMLAYWAGGNEDTSVTASRHNAMQKVKMLRDMSGSSGVVLHLTAAGSTKGDRFVISTVKPYQGQRKAGRKPKNWEYLRGLLQDYEGPLFRTKMWHSREADDGIALCAYDTVGKGQVPIAIASKDKDMRMLPGLHVNWDTYEPTRVLHNEFSVGDSEGKQFGHKWFWLQMLQGDSADNIPGLPHYRAITGMRPLGPVTARLLLEDCEDNAEAYRTVLGLYQSFYGTFAKAAMVEQAMLLWLRTDAGASMLDFLRIMPEDPELRAQARIKAIEVEGLKCEAINLANQSASAVCRAHG